VTSAAGYSGQAGAGAGPYLALYLTTYSTQYVTVGQVFIID